MTPVARMVMLNLRTVAPYRYQCLAVFAVVVLLFVNRPVALVPTLVLLFTATMAAYPFNVGDKARLETLYATLPLARRSVLFGHYGWALACYLCTVIAGTALALLLARLQSVPLGGRTLAAVLTLSWGTFAVNVAVQFPLFTRYGYTRVSVLSTVLPLAFLAMLVVRLHLSLASARSWLPWTWPVGAAMIVASAAVAITLDRRRVHPRL
jgi:hypothetical protein